ncbi:hypothetical protein FRUB_09969 [Fimbriiglobus ruber]|uniref:Uncharacterized protein n=1 Tax=Fimbriiglobus ruber TaxID=1908690 RepID=A0A225DGA6_9BACT|nr:hypothetical protein FRUB_09969 [Fimbriiglobus ruber]
MEDLRDDLSDLGQNANDATGGKPRFRMILKFQVLPPAERPACRRPAR